MLRLAKERDRLTVIDDQFGAPTGAELLADVTAHAIRDTLRDASKSGLYHVVAGGDHSLKFARKDPAAQAAVYDDVQRTMVEWMRTMKK